MYNFVCLFPFNFMKRLPKFLKIVIFVEILLAIIVAVWWIIFKDLDPDVENVLTLIWEISLFLFLGLTAVIFSVWMLLWGLILFFSGIFGAFFVLYGKYVLSPAHIKKEWKTVKDVIHYALPKWYSPMEIALIYNWTEHTDIVPIALYYRASKWYLRIVECEKKLLFIVRKKVKFQRVIKKYEFENVMDRKSALRPDLEEELRNHIVKNSEEEIDESYIRRNEKTLDIRDIMFRMDRSLKAKITPGYIKRYENRFTNKYPLILLLIWAVISYFYLYYWIALIVLSVLFMVSFRHYMMVRERNKNINEENYLSEGWRNILEQVHWFRKYLMQVEDAKLETLTKEDPDYYEKILPYAIALWVGDEWVKKHTTFLSEYWFEVNISWA